MRCMFKQDSSGRSLVTSPVRDSLNNKVNSRMMIIIIAMAAAGILLSLFASQFARGSLILAAGIAVAAIGFVIGSDYRRGWLVLLVVSTTSVIQVRFSSFNIRPDEVMFIWLTVIWLCSFVIGKVRLRHTPMLIPVIGIIGVNLLSTFLYAPDKTFGYQSSLLIALYLSMYIITVNVLSENPKLLKATPFIFVVLGVAQAGYGLIGLAGHALHLKLGGITTSTAGFGIAASGGFQEENILGAFLAVVALILLAHVAAKTRWWRTRRAFLATGMVIVISAFICTFTRTAWIGFVVGALSLIVIMRPPRNFFDPRTLAILLSMASIFFAIGMPLGNYLSKNNGGNNSGLTDRISNLLNFSQGSGQGRMQIESLALSRWENSPLLGNGTYSMPKTGPGRTAQGSWLYSSVIQSLHDTGLVGTIFLIWIYIGGAIIGIRGIYNSSTRFWKATIAGGTLGWIALIISSQASSTAWLSVSWIYLGLLVSWSLNVRMLEAETS